MSISMKELISYEGYFGKHLLILQDLEQDILYTNNLKNDYKKKELYKLYSFDIIKKRYQTRLLINLIGLESMSFTDIKTFKKAFDVIKHLRFEEKELNRLEVLLHKV